MIYIKEEKPISGLITHVGVTWSGSKDKKIYRNLGLPRRSPIFKDGRFVLIPIVEDYMCEYIYGESFCAEPHLSLINKKDVEKRVELIRDVEKELGIKILRTYRDIPIRVPGYTIEDFAWKPYYLDIPVHDDPEFTTFTYGPAGTRLQYGMFCRLRKGSKLFFVTTLYLYNNEDKKFVHPHRWWYVIGYFDVEEVVIIGTKEDRSSADFQEWISCCPEDIWVEPSYEVINKYLNNVHIRREAVKAIVNGSWREIYSSKRFEELFIGSPAMIVKGSSESKLLEYAVPLTPKVLNYAGIFGGGVQQDPSISSSTNIKDLFKFTRDPKTEFKEVTKRIRGGGNVKPLYKDGRGFDSAKMLLEVIDYVQRNPEVVKEFIEDLLKCVKPESSSL